MGLLYMSLDAEIPRATRQVSAKVLSYLRSGIQAEAEVETEILIP